jgi:DNA mismatch repair protein MutS
MSAKVITQFKTLQTNYPDHILMIRIGDFYECLGKDAAKVAEILDTPIASRKFGPRPGDRINMTGIPYFKLWPSVEALVEAGHSVAVAEAIPGAEAIEGLIPREIAHVNSPDNPPG